MGCYCSYLLPKQAEGTLPLHCCFFTEKESVAEPEVITLDDDDDDDNDDETAITLDDDDDAVADHDAAGGVAINSREARARFGVGNGDWRSKLIEFVRSSISPLLLLSCNVQGIDKSRIMIRIR